MVIMRGVSIDEEVPTYENPIDLLWPVYEEYHIKNGFIIPVTYHIKREYNPMDVPNLFQQFAQLLNDFDLSIKESHDSYLVEKRDKQVEEAILKWVGKYGRLHDFEATANQSAINDMSLKSEIKYYRDKIFEARESLDNYQAFLDTIGDECFDYDGLKFAYQDTFNLFLLNDSPLSNVRFGVKLKGNPPAFFPVYIPDNLLDAMWLQFWQLISNQGKLKKCNWCGKLFSYKNEKQWYCPGDEFSCKSPCQNNHSKWMNTRKRQSFRLFRQGKSVNEVTAILSREKKHIEKSKIQDWWNEFNK